MRLLIDGYNLMYAVIAPDRGRRPKGLRRDRQRFLNELAALLGPLDSTQTTIVFDASENAPDHLPHSQDHKGMMVIFAKGDEDADSRLESLIAKHSAPKTLTVVSTDHRIQRAALRRKARAITSDEFWSQLKNHRRMILSRPTGQARPPGSERETRPMLGPTESAFWMDVFADVATSPEARQVFDSSESMLTDEEIRRIAEEVRRED